VEPFGLSCTLEWDGRGVRKNDKYSFLETDSFGKFLQIMTFVVSFWSDEVSRVHVVLVSIFVVLLPVFIIVFCYTKIVLLVRKSDRLVRDQRLRKTNPVVSDSQLTVVSFMFYSGSLKVELANPSGEPTH